MLSDTSNSTASLLYKYVNITNLRRILGGSIRFTQPSAFNDPFELLPAIVVPSMEKERPISVSFDITASRRGSHKDRVVSQSGVVAGSDAMSRDTVQQLNQQIGILSLSKVKDSLLMWSHYADQYAGAVVVFDASHEFFSNPIDVEYQSERPREDLSFYLDGAPIPIAELCTKSDQWAYEQEVRIIRQQSECQRTGVDARGFPVFVRAVPSEAIKAVMLGERTPIREQREIFARIMDTHISLALAAIDHSGFAFREEMIKFGVPIAEMGPMMSPRTAQIFRDLPGQRGELARWMIEHHPLSKVVNRPV